MNNKRTLEDDNDAKQNNLNRISNADSHFSADSSHHSENERIVRIFFFYNFIQM